MSETVFGILLACVLYFAYFFLSKIIRKFKRKAAPVKLSTTRRWVRRWGFACNWLAVCAFIWMAMVSFQSLAYDSASPRSYRVEGTIEHLNIDLKRKPGDTLIMVFGITSFSKRLIHFFKITGEK